MADFIDQHGLLNKNDGVVVAVSGGSDSVALLAALAELAADKNRQYRLVAAHLNHGLVEEVGEDAEFIADLARRLRIPCICEKGDVPAAAAAANISKEEAGREVRYAFLARVAESRGCHAIATGHQRDDQVETVLHRIIRGTGLEGLSGISVMRTLAGGIRLIRPLLCITRAGGPGLPAQRKLPWKTDPTNADADYNTRNHIRHELLPLLREHYNPRVDEALARLAELAAVAQPHLKALGSDAFFKVLRRRADSELSLQAADLAAMDKATASLAIRAAIRQLDTPMQEMGQFQVEQILDLAAARDGGSRRIDLPGGLRALRQYDKLILSRQVSRPANSEKPQPNGKVMLQAPGETLLSDGHTLRIEFREGGAAALRAFRHRKDFYAEMLDADKLDGTLIARRWLPGDEFWPLGAPGRQKLSDFFITAKVPLPMRGRAWLICDQRGIIWLAPHRLVHRVRVTNRTRRVALLSIGPGAPAD